MKIIRNMITIFFCIIIICCVVGCSKTYFKGLDPQSHFDYPNSNVIPLGKVMGEASRTAIFSFPMVDSDLMEEAIQNALSKKGEADLLLNSMQFETRTDILFVHSLVLRVEGTAAKMVIGEQKLR